MSRFEKYYSKMLNRVFKAINPIKKRIISTQCVVHQFINLQGLIILKNDGYLEASEFLSKYIRDINKGAIWADQDFKSSTHFYNPEKDRGLYGRSNAKKECIGYYSDAINSYYKGDISRAMFFLGAAAHLMQDMTVPQHVIVKLAGHHRKYEQWVIREYKEKTEFKIYSNGIYLNSIAEYIDYNTKIAYSTYKRYLGEKDLNKLFYETTLITLSAAERTTAGVFLKFYNDIKKLDEQKDKGTSSGGCH